MNRQFDCARDYEAVLRLWQSAGPGVRLGASDSPGEILKQLERAPGLFRAAEHEADGIGAVMGAFDGRRGAVCHLT